MVTPNRPTKFKRLKTCMGAEGGSSGCLPTPSEQNIAALSYCQEQTLIFNAYVQITSNLVAFTNSMLAKTARAGSSGCTKGGNPKTSRNNLCHFGPVRAAKLGDTKNSTFPKMFQRRFGKYMGGAYPKNSTPPGGKICVNDQ